MTSQVAITLLKSLEQSLDSYCELNDEGKTAFRMAIESLELFGNSEHLPPAQPEIIACGQGELVQDGLRLVQDCIDRQAAIDALDCNFTITGKDNAETVYRIVKGFSDKIKALPTVQPAYTDAEIQKMQDLESAEIEKAYELGYEEGKKDAQPKTGRWIHDELYPTYARCNVCG
jgi:hypothetical protein